VIETRYKKSTIPVTTDGRDIDTSMGVLAGEAAQQIATPADEHLLEAVQAPPELPMTRPGDPTYYEVPMLKSPVWEWVVPAYYYAGGAAGASLAIGAAAQFDRTGRLDNLVRRCHLTGIIGSAVSGCFLVWDLGRPSRFLNMMRVFRPTSPMNMGVWILSCAAPTAFAAGLLTRRRGWLGGIGEGFGYASGVFGAALATYTGVLVANSAVPVWQASRHVLPILFGASAIASAGSLFDLAFEDPKARRICYTFGTIGRVAELAAGFVMEKQVSAVPAVGKPLHRGASGMMWKMATALTAGSLIAGLLPGVSRRRRIAAGVMGTLGSIMLRNAVHYAGVASSRDPRASFAQQHASRLM
jgi:formate-dependent nitrite reductase membrane component NrfD